MGSRRWYHVLLLAAAARAQDPTKMPVPKPTDVPTSVPTSEPTAEPTGKPSRDPTSLPTSEPTKTPTSAPTKTPTTAPTSKPSIVPTSTPTYLPTGVPTGKPSAVPTFSQPPSGSPMAEQTAAVTAFVGAVVITETTVTVISTEAPTFWSDTEENMEPVIVSRRQGGVAVSELPACGCDDDTTA